MCFLCLQTLTDRLPYLDSCRSWAANDWQAFVSQPRLSWAWFNFIFIYLHLLLFVLVLNAGRQADRQIHPRCDTISQSFGSRTEKRHLSLPSALITCMKMCGNARVCVCVCFDDKVAAYARTLTTPLLPPQLKNPKRCKNNFPPADNVGGLIKTSVKSWRPASAPAITAVFSDSKRLLNGTIIAFFGGEGGEMAHIFLMTDAVWAWLWWSS